MEKEFKELMSEIGKLHMIPSGAIKEIPIVLSEETKRKMLKRKPEELANILVNAISRINDGSIETLDTIITRLLRDMMVDFEADEMENFPNVEKR